MSATYTPESDGMVEAVVTVRTHAPADAWELAKLAVRNDGYVVRGMRSCRPAGPGEWTVTLGVRAVAP
jgi:hypothetical protein